MKQAKNCGFVLPEQITFLGMLLWLTVGSNLSQVPIRASAQKAHIEGTVFGYKHSPMYHAEVKFTDHDEISRSVFTDQNGFYETDLPAGLYAMTVRSDRSKVPEYVRPPFRVAASLNLTFDPTLDPQLSCEATTTTGELALTEDEALNACGGRAIFSIPSKDNVPFQLSIGYVARRMGKLGYEYLSENIPGGKIPVTVAYNLFTLRANQVRYDIKTHTLHAIGDVIVERADGPTRKAESATVRFKNGEAVALR